MGEATEGLWSMSTGWTALVGRVVGNPESAPNGWQTTYTWDGTYHPSKEQAERAGISAAEADGFATSGGFNLAEVVDGRIVWFGTRSAEWAISDPLVGAAADQFGWCVSGRKCGGPSPDVRRWCSNCQQIVSSDDTCAKCGEPTADLPAGNVAPLVVQQQVDELLGEVARLHAEVQAARPDVTWHCASSDCHRGHGSDYVGENRRHICAACSTEEHEVAWYRCDLR